MAMAKKLIKVEITSDSVCPWCYIGYRRFEKGLQLYKDKHGDVGVDVVWHPYLLAPEMTQPVRKADHYRQKFGEARTEKMFTMLQTIGEPLGIKFRFEGMIGPTLDSHRLIEYARSKDLQTPTVLRIFQAYFEQNKDIADHAVLTDAGVAAGLEREEVASLLRGTEYARAVKQELQQAHMNQIDAVPHFIFDETDQVAGGQEPETFLRILERQ